MSWSFTQIWMNVDIDTSYFKYATCMHINPLPVIHSQYWYKLENTIIIMIIYSISPSKTSKQTNITWQNNRFMFFNTHDSCTNIADGHRDNHKHHSTNCLNTFKLTNSGIWTTGTIFCTEIGQTAYHPWPGVYIIICKLHFLPTKDSWL